MINSTILYLLGGRQGRYSETALSEAHYSEGYLYLPHSDNESGSFITKFQLRRSKMFSLQKTKISISISKESVNSGSIVADYGLDDRAIRVRSPAGAKDFSSSLCVQTGSGVHPASCTMGTGGRFPGDKSAAGA
jgi:hypothetical protein